MQAPRRHHPSREEVQRRHALPPADVAKRAVRLSSLKKLSRAFGNIDNFAFAAELAADRLEALLQGKVPLTNEMVMHLEAAINLEPGWMDSTMSEYGKKQGQQLLSEKELLDRDGDHGTSTNVASPVTVPAAVLTKAVPPKASVVAIAPTTGAALAQSGAAVPVTVKKSKVSAPQPVVATPEPVVAIPEPAAGILTAVPASAPALASPEPAQAIATPLPAKAIAGAKPKNEVLQRIRRMNLTLLTAGPGEKAGLSRELGIHASQISLKLDGRRIMSDKFCRKIEAAYKLKQGWMDSPRVTLSPDIRRLTASKRVVIAAPAPVAQKPAAQRPVVASSAPKGAVPKAVAHQAVEREAPVASSPPAAVATQSVTAPAMAAPVPLPVMAAPTAAPATLATESVAATLGKASPLARVLIELITYRSAAGLLSDQKINQLQVELLT